MKRLRIVGLCVVAALGVSVAVATSASAAPPTWFECAKAPKVGKTHTGNYNDKLCTSFNAEGTGRFVLREGVGASRRARGRAD